MTPVPNVEVLCGCVAACHGWVAPCELTHTFTHQHSSRAVCVCVEGGCGGGMGLRGNLRLVRGVGGRGGSVGGVLKGQI